MLGFGWQLTRIQSWFPAGTSAGATAAQRWNLLTTSPPRLVNRVQITTDGLKAYIDAIDTAFGGEVDYAVLIKLFGEPIGGKSERRYSPAECTGIRKEAIQGDPRI